MTEISAAAKMTEARREVGYRRRVYARLVADGRMKADEADRRIAVMAAIGDDYAAIVETEKKGERLL